MKIQCDKKDRTLFVKLQGEIDHHFTEELREKIDKQFNTLNCQNIVLDFEEVTFMDSSGIGMIIGRYKLSKEKNGQTLAFGLKGNAKRIFDMSGLNKIISCFDTKEQSIQSL